MTKISYPIDRELFSWFGT